LLRQALCPQTPRPWRFSLLILPLGVIVGFKSAPLRFLLAQARVSVDRIAAVVSRLSLPGVFAVLLAPLAEISSAAAPGLGFHPSQWRDCSASFFPSSAPGA